MTGLKAHVGRLVATRVLNPWCSLCGSRDWVYEDRRSICALECELCTAVVATAPATAKKYRKPGWHVVCKECMRKITPGSQIKFMGRIKRGDKKLPKKLPI